MFGYLGRCDDRRAIVLRLTAERAITLASARGLADAAQNHGATDRAMA